MDESVEKVLPTPRKNEKQDAFVSRCMSNAEAKREFPEQKQRLAVCFSQFRKKKNKTVDEELDTFVVTVLDEQTGEVIRQIPTEEMLELAKSISDAQDSAPRGIFKGVLFQGRA